MLSDDSYHVCRAFTSMTEIMREQNESHRLEAILPEEHNNRNLHPGWCFNSGQKQLVSVASPPCLNVTAVVGVTVSGAYCPDAMATTTTRTCFHIRIGRCQKTRIRPLTEPDCCLLFLFLFHSYQGQKIMQASYHCCHHCYSHAWQTPLALLTQHSCSFKPLHMRCANKKDVGRIEDDVVQCGHGADVGTWSCGWGVKFQKGPLGSNNHKNAGLSLCSLASDTSLAVQWCQILNESTGDLLLESSSDSRSQHSRRPGVIRKHRGSSDWPHPFHKLCWRRRNHWRHVYETELCCPPMFSLVNGLCFGYSNVITKDRQVNGCKKTANIFWQAAGRDEDWSLNPDCKGKVWWRDAQWYLQSILSAQQSYGQ